MRKKELKERILSLTDDINFIYKNIEGSICPFSKSNISVSFGDEVYDFNNINDVMSAKIINGYSFNDISEYIEFM